MSGPTCAIYSRRKLEPAILDSIDAALAAISSPLERTRKGRVWECWIDGRPVSVSIENSENALWDCEDDLLGLGLLADDAPFRVVLAAGCNDERDYRILNSISGEISLIVEGVVVGPTK
jgi:hypothetical protein